MADLPEPVFITTTSFRSYTAFKQRICSGWKDSSCRISDAYRIARSIVIVLQRSKFIEDYTRLTWFRWYMYLVPKSGDNCPLTITKIHSSNLNTHGDSIVNPPNNTMYSSINIRNSPTRQCQQMGPHTNALHWRIGLLKITSQSWEEINTCLDHKSKLNSKIKQFFTLAKLGKLLVVWGFLMSSYL